jgi:hypothetical protein
MRFVRRIILGGNLDRRFILNMDQTPVYFLMNVKRTLSSLAKRRSTFARRRTTKSQSERGGW